MTSRERARVATQARVLAEAERLFHERGFEATTIRGIADASGVSVGSVMSAGDKRALLVRVFDALVEEHQGAVSLGDLSPGDLSAGAADARGTCPDRLLLLVRPFVELFTTRRDLSRTYASILVSGQHTSILFSELSARLVEDMRATITRAGCTDPGSSESTARALYLAYVGALFAWASGPADEPAVLEGSLRTAFTAICRCGEEPS